MVKTRKSELHFINLKIPTRLGTKFQLELTILIFFGSNLSTNRYLWSKRQKANITNEF